MSNDISNLQIKHDDIIHIPSISRPNYGLAISGTTWSIDHEGNAIFNNFNSNNFIPNVGNNLLNDLDSILTIKRSQNITLESNNGEKSNSIIFGNGILTMNQEDPLSQTKSKSKLVIDTKNLIYSTDDGVTGTYKNNLKVTPGSVEIDTVSFITSNLNNFLMLCSDNKTKIQMVTGKIETYSNSQTYTRLMSSFYDINIKDGNDTYYSKLGSGRGLQIGIPQASIFMNDTQLTINDNSKAYDINFTTNSAYIKHKRGSVSSYSGINLDNSYSSIYSGNSVLQLSANDNNTTSYLKIVNDTTNSLLEIDFTSSVDGPFGVVANNAINKHNNTATIPDLRGFKLYDHEGNLVTAGGNIDLSNYVTKTEHEELISAYNNLLEAYNDLAERLNDFLDDIAPESTPTPIPGNTLVTVPTNKED